MLPMLDWGSGVVGYLVRSSVHAAVLIVLILCVQILFRRALSPRWRAALWFLLLIRLVVPWGPESRASVYNAVPWLMQGTPQAAAPAPLTAMSPVDTPTVQQTQRPRFEYRESRPAMSMKTVALAVWGLGAGLMLLLVLYVNLRFIWRVRRIAPVTAEQVTSLLERCKEEMGVYAPISIVVTGEISMPSLLGFVRPRILLPEGLLETLRPDQLRFILLHELAHVKRLDIVVGWLTVAIQAVHWFNPLVWYAAYRMQADREMACDAAVLTRAGKERADDYGGTIIALLERSSKLPRLVPAAALAETRAQLKRRITMIAAFKKTTPWLSAVAALIVAGLAIVTLTNAVRPTAHAQQAEPAQDLPDYVPATSTIGADGQIVDKIDWPFVNDPNVIGTWNSVDFVREQQDFKPGRQQFPGDLFLKGLTFLPLGRTQQVWTWTKGLLIHHGDITASVYTIKSFDGEPYMFLEWKSGDYTIRKMKPMYYVLKKDLNAPEPPAGAAAYMTDEAFRSSKKPLVVQLVRNIDTATRETIETALGEPIQYIWGQTVFTRENLPDCYIMQYPDRVDFWIKDGRIAEVRFYTPGWVFANAIQVGSTVDEVLQALGQPVEMVVGQKNEFKDGVLYKDIDGRTGYCYYHRKDQGVRCFFTNYAVGALYVTRSDF